MNRGSLTDLQCRILSALAGISPPWTLTGGGAIVGFHAPYRATRDLDLFWHGRDLIGDLDLEVAGRLRTAGLAGTQKRKSPAFVQMEVSLGGEACALDLVADPAPTLDKPLRREIDGHEFLVDTLQDLAVNKLIAMLSRFELRDLADLRELLRLGVDLDRALLLAPKKDGGFSVMTLTWVLESYPYSRYKPEAMLRPESLVDLGVWRESLIAQLKSRSDPGDRVCERP
jgi:hypothetical protein